MLNDYILEVQDAIKGIKASCPLHTNGWPVPWKWRGTQEELERLTREDYEGLIEVGYEHKINAAEIAHEIVDSYVHSRYVSSMVLPKAGEILKEIKEHYKN